jgi:putative FmdB family regulatory protein
LTPGAGPLIIKSRGFARRLKLPLYEYVCTQCGQHIEKIQKFSDHPLTKCEKCVGKLKRLVSSPAIQFKGSGWYVTDYARKPSAAPANTSASSGNGDKGKAPEATKSEAATAKKPEVKSHKSE